AEPGRRGSAIVIAAGLVLIAGIAVAFAWSLTPGSRPAPEARPPAAAAPPAPQLQAEVAPTPGPQTTPSALAMTLRVAPPLAFDLRDPRAATTMAPALASPTPVRPTAPAVQASDAARAADPIGERLAALLPALAAPTPAPQAAPAQTSEPAPPPTQARVQPAFDCAAARTAAQQMVCGDPELAAADQRMSRAYRAALAAGAPEDQLRSEQQDWLGIREDAARRSRNAVASIYEQRIDELRRWRAEAAADREPEP
ncbi:MAG TPA: lysozyme inhibitor LprI family protein, partial [Phenylobacterium sp.]|nr:lysozyme inhibitor LprI family protein [Phenylobacterium sp.]